LANDASPVSDNINNFPACGSLLSQSGDKAHYANGSHQIVGGALLTGSDDVYSLDNGNFVQCFCPENGGSGVQTNWYRTDSEVTGWFFVNGTQWNLGNFKYAAKNLDFNCHPTIVTTPATTESAPQPCNGCGGVSTPVCDSSKPLAPTNLTVVRTGTVAKLSWIESDNTTHYSIVYGTKPGLYEYGVVNTGKTNTFVVGSLDPGTKYYFAVNGVNNCMPSDKTSTGEILGASTIDGLATTGTMSQIIGLFSVCAISLILFIGISKLISLCENSENIHHIIEVTKTVAGLASAYCLNQLRNGNVVYVGKILQSSSFKLYELFSVATAGRYQNPYRNLPSAFAYSFSSY
jgi:hypothetical protein